MPALLPFCPIEMISRDFADIHYIKAGKKWCMMGRVKLQDYRAPCRRRAAVCFYVKILFNAFPVRDRFLLLDIVY
jgi:hypothetical protein